MIFGVSKICISGPKGGPGQNTGDSGIHWYITPSRPGSGHSYLFESFLTLENNSIKTAQLIRASCSNN